MRKVKKLSSFGVFYQGLRGSQQKRIREILTQDLGVSSNMVYKYCDGTTDIQKIAPAVKRIITEEFPDAESILFPEKEVQS